MKKFAQSHRLSVERVVSGRGLAHVYEFLVQEYPTNRVDKMVHNELLAVGDKQGKVIADNATAGSLCLEAMEIVMA